MSDEPFYAPKHQAAPKPRKPREVLCTFTSASDVPMSCEMFNHGEFGLEVQVLERGELREARGGFRTREEALAWANDERRALEG